MDSVTKKTYLATIVVAGKGDFPSFTSCADITAIKTFLFNGIPYIVYTDCEAGQKLTVKKFNGMDWETVGEPGISIGGAGYREIQETIFPELRIEVHDDTPYVAYLDRAQEQKLTVRKFDGSVWQTLGTEGFSVGQVRNLSLAMDPGTIYVGYQDSTGSVIQMYNGKGWEIVSPAPRGVNVIDVFNGRIYTAYLTNMQQVTVEYLNAGSWNPTGAQGITAKVVGELEFSLSGSVPHTAYLDTSNGAPVIMNYTRGSWLTLKDFNAPLMKSAYQGENQQPLKKESSAQVIYNPPLEFAVDNEGSVFISYNDTAEYNAGMGIYAYIPDTWLNWTEEERLYGIYSGSFSSADKDLIAAYKPLDGVPTIFGYWHMEPVVAKRSAGKED
jgi:hypothetical protein